MPHPKLAIAAVLLGFGGGVAVGGCAADAEGQDRPAPAVQDTRRDLQLTPAVTKPLVKFTGLVNDDTPISADLASLDALPQQTVTTYEPFVKENVTFTGVGFADLLDAVDATGDSVTVHALDNYERRLDVAVLREPGVLLATREEGQEIPISKGGPVRLIFPDTSDAGADESLWVWSVDRIIVE